METGGGDGSETGSVTELTTSISASLTLDFRDKEESMNNNNSGRS